MTTLPETPETQSHPEHAHVYERLSVCCGSVKQDSDYALYDAHLEPVCHACGCITTMTNICWCGKVEEAE